MRTQYLELPEGKIAYDRSGEGPLVICVPGMGDLRSSFDDVRAVLAERGFSVATMDLRGHGDSDATFAEYGSAPTGGDLVALLAELGESAVVIGNSMGAGAGVAAAAERPRDVDGLVLLGPFVRDAPMGAIKRLAIRTALLRPWGPALWAATYRRLQGSNPPENLAAHTARIRSGLRRRDHWRAFVTTTRSSHAAVAARLDDVRRNATPVRVLMGAEDPDFADPALEATEVAAALGGSAEVLDGVGHYPQMQVPERVADAVAEIHANGR